MEPDLNKAQKEAGLVQDKARHRDAHSRSLALPCRYCMGGASRAGPGGRGTLRRPPAAAPATCPPHCLHRWQAAPGPSSVPREDGATLREDPGRPASLLPLSPEGGRCQGAAGGPLHPPPALTWAGAPGHSPRGPPPCSSQAVHPGPWGGGMIPLRSPSREPPRRAALEKG